MPSPFYPRLPCRRRKSHKMWRIEDLANANFEMILFIDVLLRDFFLLTFFCVISFAYTADGNKGNDIFYSLIIRLYGYYISACKR